MCKERAIEGSSSLLRAFVWMSELFVQLVRRWRTLACESATALAFHSNVVSIALSLAVVHAFSLYWSRTLTESTCPSLR